MDVRVANVAQIAGFAALYLIAARIGLTVDSVAGLASLVWPPTGLSLAALLVFGFRLWPGILIGATLANLLGGASLGMALGIGTGNTLEAVVGAHLVRRVPGFVVTLESVRSVVAFVLLGGMLATLISATIGVTSLLIGDRISTSQIAHTGRAWWVGDMVGALLVAPIVLVWSGPPVARFPRHAIERAALAASLVVVSVMIFFSRLPHVPTLVTPFHQTDVLLAVLTWAAFRFGQRGAATAAFFVCAIAVAGTALGSGPFAQDELHLSLLSLQTFMATVAATLLLLGATVSEWRSAHVREMQAHQEAVRANRAKSEFLAIMSHELRTPLNAIAGYSELMRTGVYGPLTEKQMDAVTRVQRNERQLLALVDEVLGFVSAEKGEVDETCESVAVAKVFDAVQPQIETEFEGKHFVLRRDLSRPTLAVQANPESLKRILVCLLSNACKYTGDGGLITLGAERDGKKVRIWVGDTGVGIAPGELQRVFEPFAQGDQSRTRRYSGIGLGLTIARDLARRMNGELTIASEVGSGTTASVVLPAA